MPVSIYAAVHHGGRADRLTILAAVVALAIPGFLLGLLIMYVFSVWLGWLVPSGITGWTSCIMPVATMAIAASAIFARVTGRPWLR